MKTVLRFVLPVIIFTTLCWSSESPKREMRAAWVATAAPDFPISSTTAGQQNEIKALLNTLKDAGFNAVIFQIRPGCDAFYASSYEPWSHLLTGSSGRAPSPFYDPLEYFIKEAHARGMELHAWFNPFRLTTSSLTSLHSTHIYNEHPEWKMNHATKMLDPGKQAVRDYTVDVFMDVVNRYDIDAVHMDDYFYPYDGMSTSSPEDAATFAAESRGFTNIENWRRDNVNRFMEALYDSIQTQKPWVKLGVSPFGIWKYNVPAGIVGLSSYSDIFADPIAWLNDGSIDYLTPQLYWSFGGGQDYNKLMPWWASQVNAVDRHLYVGQGNYKINNSSYGWPSGWNANELPKQIRLNRSTDGSLGSVHFRLRNGLFNNPKGFMDSLKTDLYLRKALIPAMSFKDDIPPNPPVLLFWNGDGGHRLVWDAPSVASDGDNAHEYVVYRSETNPVDVSLASNILDVIPASLTTYLDETSGEFYYALSALDRLKNESPAIQGIVSIDEIAHLPEAFQLYPNFPNPFNPSTQIRIDIGEAQYINLAVYDIRGQHIRDIFQGYIGSGNHQFEFNSRGSDGSVLAAGVYLLRFDTEHGSQTQRMLLLK